MGGAGYFAWLCSLIHDWEDYSLLLWALYSKDYYYDEEFPIDSCRGEDGLDLRRKYLAQNSISKTERVYLETRSCSCLEWLLGMAIRCENQIMYNEEEGDRTGLWFWTMIENMDISIDDDHWDDAAGLFVSNVLDDILLRNFPSDGAGTPFPLSEKDEDVRECDWWRAMNLWLSENFFEEFEL